MRRKNRPKVAWFPKDPEFVLLLDGTAKSNIVEAELDLEGLPGTSITGVVPVVFDQTHFPDGSGGINSLSDIENSGYRLRRIVGKCFVSVLQADNLLAPNLIICAAAFIVLRTDDLGQTANQIAAYNLFEIGNDDSPYIWRREWILSNAGATEPAQDTEDWPFTNAEYGSIADGPHIDQKTARVIGKDERLFFVCSAMVLKGGSVDEGGTKIRFRVTPRILGSMRSTLGNRNNASR